MVCTQFDLLTLFMQADLVLPTKNRYCVVCRRCRRCLRCRQCGGGDGGRGCCLRFHHATMVAGVSEFSSDVH